MNLLSILGLFLIGASLVSQDVEEILFRKKHKAGVVLGTATPTLVQMKATPSDVQAQEALSAIAHTGNLITTCFPNATQSGNTVIAHVRTSEATNTDIALSDDGSGSNTYTQQAHETAGSRTNAVFTAPVTNSSRCVTVTFNDAGGDQTDNLIDIYEFANVGAIDVTCTGTATSGTVPACSSSMTPTVGNDLVMTFVDVVTFSSKPTGSMTWTAQTGSSPTYTKLHSDGTSWSASQYGIDSATSAITPSMTISTATTRANVVGIAMKASAGGGTFAGIHVYNVKTFAPEYANSTAIAGTSQVIEFPCFGNSEWLAVGQGASSSTSNTTGITGVTPTTTFTALTNLYSSGDGFAVQWWHVDGVTCTGSQKITLAFTANPTFLTIVAVDIANATGYDSSATCGAGSTPCPINNANSTATTTFAGATITPSTATGVVLSYQNQDFQTIASTTAGNWVSSIESCPNAAGGLGCTGGGAGTYKAYAYGGSGFEQDDGALVQYYSSTSPISITWNIAQTQSGSNSGQIGPAFSSTVAVKQ